jgi:serine/threonine-protein kinase
VPEIGELVVKKYRLERLLGTGGMASVFEAVHVHIGKRVAIKFLRPDLWTDAEQLNRFHREAQAAAAVGHEGIIDIFDLGVSDDGAPFLVMELLEGHSLGDRLAFEGRLSVSRASYITCQVLSALDAAHRAGVVHRDLKPDNIFLVDRGAALPGVKLLDFGISRVTGVGSGDLESIRLTQTGALLGTPVYMSPEQAQGLSDIDHSTDIYSATAVFYESLTGRPPLTAENYNALIARILTDTIPPPSRWRDDLPVELEDVIQRGLAKDRDDRYRRAGLMLRELLPFLDEGAESWISLPDFSDEPIEVRARPMAAPRETPKGGSGKTTIVAPPPGRRWVPWVGGLSGLVLAALAGAAVTSWRGDDQRAEGPARDASTASASLEPGDPISSAPTDSNAPSAELITEPEADRGSIADDGGPSVNVREDDASTAEASPGQRVGRPRTKGPSSGARPRLPPQPQDQRVKGRLGTAIQTEYEKG